MFRFIIRFFLLLLDVQVGVARSPVLLHDPTYELLHINYFLVGILLIKLRPTPDEHFVASFLRSVIFIDWLLAKHKQGIFFKILEVEHGHGLVPVGILEQLWLCLLLFLYNVSVVLHLSDHWSLFNEVYGLKLYKKGSKSNQNR